jgi:hypothetical protein
MTTLATTPDAPASLHTNADGEVVGLTLDGTRYPLRVLRRALRHQYTLYQIAQALGFEDTGDDAAILERVRELADRSS